MLRNEDTNKNIFHTHHKRDMESTQTFSRKTVLPFCFPDRPFHHFRASRSGDPRILSISETSFDGFWSSKVVKGSVGSRIQLTFRGVHKLMGEGFCTSYLRPSQKVSNFFSGAGMSSKNLSLSLSFIPVVQTFCFLWHHVKPLLLLHKRSELSGVKLSRREKELQTENWKMHYIWLKRSRETMEYLNCTNFSRIMIIFNLTFSPHFYLGYLDNQPNHDRPNDQRRAKSILQD